MWAFLNVASRYIYHGKPYTFNEILAEKQVVEIPIYIYITSLIKQNNLPFPFFEDF